MIIPAHADNSAVITILKDVSSGLSFIGWNEASASESATLLLNQDIGCLKVLEKTY
jgi:hypothetical protein